MNIKTGSREEAIRALIELWLRDKRKSCMYCSRSQDFEDCGNCRGIDPPLATNKEILQTFALEMQQIRQTRKNKFASSDNKDIRYAVSMPASLYQFLRLTFKNMYKEELFTDEYNIVWFMRKFGKYFAVPEEV